MIDIYKKKIVSIIDSIESDVPIRKKKVVY